MQARSWVAGLLLVAGCASAPRVPPPEPVTVEEHLATILWLEDRRVLGEPSASDAPGDAGGRSGDAPQAQADHATAEREADLVALLRHAESRVRWRAALAVGRVGLAEGVAPLASVLADEEPAVRAMAAFGLGLLGEAAAVEPLTAALADPEPRVAGRAAEALGLIGEPARASGDAIGEMVRAALAGGALAALPPDDTRDIPPEADQVRLGLYALVRLGAYEPLAAAVLDQQGQPRIRWWPVAYALQRLGDERAVDALLSLARDAHPYTAAFAIRGLGELEAAEALDVVLPILEGDAAPPMLQVAAVRAAAAIGDPRAIEVLTRLLAAPPADVDDNLRLEVVKALGELKAEAGHDRLLDLVQHRWPAMRAAVLGALAAIRPDEFFILLSSIDRDGDWIVRAGLATALTFLPPELAAPRLQEMLQDEDARVLPAVLRALALAGGPDLESLLVGHLTHQDMIVRATAAELARDQAIHGAVPGLVEAARAARADPGYSARTAALEALAALDPAAARGPLEEALSDKDWAVRVRAAGLLGEIDQTADVSAMRPAPVSRGREAYAVSELVQPTVSPEAYIETSRGTIRVQLNVVSAPLTVANFIALAERGFFENLRVHRVVPGFVVQDGDPRGDGRGGPGYTIRDELSPEPYLRGTMGMALSPWRDNAGSQWFITHTPQPHLDGRYTVFGRVVEGMDVVDAIRQGDVVTRVRVWDGVSMR